LTARASRSAPDPSVVATPNPTAREFDLEPADNTRLANLCGPLNVTRAVLPVVRAQRGGPSELFISGVGDQRGLWDESLSID